jgi:2'-5' RNA ligase
VPREQADSADQASLYAAAWRQFEALEQAAPHRADWATWAAGRGPHTLLMVLVRDPEVIQAVARAQQAFAFLEGVEVHAPHFLHISLQSLGFGRELTLEVDRLRQAIEHVPAFEVVLGQANAFHSAVFLETHSGGGLLQLRHAIRDAMGADLQTVDPFRDFLFHLTIAYLDERVDMPQLRARLRLLHATANMRVERVALVELPTDQREPWPRLEPLREFELGL